MTYPIKTQKKLIEVTLPLDDINVARGSGKVHPPRPSEYLALKEYRKRNGSGTVYDDPRVAVGAGRFDEVGARAEA